MNPGPLSKKRPVGKLLKTLLWAILVLGSVLLVQLASLRRAKNTAGIRASYVWGHEVNSMKPCGSDSVFWVLASPEILRQLRAAHEALRGKPYDPLFVRVVGQRSSKPTDGFAAQTNGYFEVTELLETRPIQAGECS